LSDEIEINGSETSVENNIGENNSYNSYYSRMMFNYDVLKDYDTELIESVIANPVENHELAIEFAQKIYSRNGVVSNSIDYMVSLLTLDRIVTSTSKKTERNRTSRQKMIDVLKIINDKKFIRDALFTEMLEGTCFYYFDTKLVKGITEKYLSDYDINLITEINDTQINASITTLPYKYTKIIGKKNGRYVLAFNLRYFENWDGDNIERKLKKYPKEIVDAYNKMKKGFIGNWVVLNSDNTICCKIKSKDSEPWGRNLIISAMADVEYKDYFVKTKRNVLKRVNNRVVYETFPANKQGTGSTLTEGQQKAQHNTFKQALNTNSDGSSVAFVSLASGTVVDSLNVSTDIFDASNESSLNDDIATDLGICATLIGAMSKGNYSAGVNNLQMITAQLYTWVCDIKDELVHVINKNIIKDTKNPINIYYFPTSFVNRNEFFTMMKSLYTDCSGSLKFTIASAGVDPDIYLNVMEEELEDNIYEKFKPHETTWTQSANSTKEDSGREEDSNPTNENTIISKTYNSSDIPKPSDS